MYSYFALIAKNVGARNECVSLAEAICREIPNYSIAFKADNIIFLHSYGFDSGAKSYFLNNSKGVVAGTLFRRTENSIGEDVELNIQGQESSRIIDSEGRYLIKNYWGRYISFFQGTGQNDSWILRDPTGCMPAYYFEGENYLLFFSSSDDFMKINNSKITINNINIASFLKHHLIDYADTGVKEIKKILPGEALKVHDSKIENKIYWHPRDFCRNDDFWTVEKAARALQETVIGTIHAWSGQYNTIIHRLSGGLDSTIVLSGLVTAPSRPNVVCVCYYSDGVDSDERNRARQAAKYFNVELIEKKDVAPESNLELVKEFNVSAEPMPCRYYMAKGDIEKKIVSDYMGDALFSGEGGDAIFYSGSQYCLTDYVYRNGLNVELISLAKQFSELGGRSYWYYLFAAIGARFVPPIWSVNDWWSGQISAIMPQDLFDSVNMEERLSHVLGGLSDVPVAKRIHILGSRFSNFYRHPNHPKNEVPNINPLLSQPIMELVYSIPTYLFPYNSTERGLARMAFRDMAPYENIMKQTKGGNQNYYVDLFRLNRKFLKEYILDGLLVSNGFYCRDKIAKVFSNESNSPPMAAIIGIFDTIGAETFLRRWI